MMKYWWTVFVYKQTLNLNMVAKTITTYLSWVICYTLLKLRFWNKRYILMLDNMIDMYIIHKWWI